MIATRAHHYLRTENEKPRDWKSNLGVLILIAVVQGLEEALALPPAALAGLWLFAIGAVVLAGGGDDRFGR